MLDLRHLLLCSIYQTFICVRPQAFLCAAPGWGGETKLEFLYEKKKTMELKYMKLKLHSVLKFTRSEYARQRVQNYFRKMPLEKFPVEIESLKLDFNCSGFFVNKSSTNRVFETRFLLVIIYEHATAMEIESLRLDFL